MNNKKCPSVETRLFINGKWIDGEKGTKEVIDPATQNVVAQIAQASEKQVGQAIAAAKKAFPAWRDRELADRVQFMRKISELLQEKADHLAKIMTIEEGKPLQEAKEEVLSGAETFLFAAEEARRLYGERIPAPNHHAYIIKREPIGVVAAITPWNFPSAMPTRKMAPALAAGNTILLKPSSETPLSATALFEIYQEAGLPDGVVNLVMGSSKMIGEVITKSEDVRKLTFTGSTEVGKKLFEQSGRTLKKLALELGGNAPFIVFSDADLKSAAYQLVGIKFRNNGQVCITPNRVFVHESVKEAFTKMVLEIVQTLKIGNGLDEVAIGALINKEAVDKITDLLQDATAKGAKVLCGGKRLTGGDYDHGFFFEPTVIDHIDPKMALFHKEIFGPVIPLISFKTEEEVIKMANDSEYGLASYFFTKDVRRVEEVSDKLEYGMVGVNEVSISNVETPFGGVKHSGFGRENGRYGLEEYTTVKFVDLKY